MSEVSKVIKLRELRDDNANVDKYLGNIDATLFNLERDTRQQTKMRFLEVEAKQDRFTDMLVVESEARHVLVGWLIICLFFFLIAVVI